MMIISILFGLMSCRTTETKPNILFIMSDDHAEQAISCYGSKLIETPNIDRLAHEGIRFNNSFVTNSICAPSRAVLLTGKYSHLNGLRDNRDEFDGSQMTFPKLLQEAGYKTTIIGKWHLKTTPTGFDDWRILIGQGGYYNPRFNDNGDIKQYTGYTTDLITSMAIESLEKLDRGQPFCMLVHHKAPHRNWMPDTKYLDAFKDQDLPIPETFYDDYSTRSAAAKEADMRIDDMYLSLDMKLYPGYYSRETGTGGNANADPENTEKAWQNLYESLTEDQRKAWDSHYIPINVDFKEKKLSGKELLEWKYQRYIKDYLRCILSVDESIGRLLDYLDEAGIAENTIVVYTSDQGFYLGEHGWYDKRFMYEESLSMPLLIRYPKEVKGGQVSDEIVLNLDFAPTFLDYAGVPVPEEMQGKSLSTLNRGVKPSDWRTSMYYHYYEYPHGWHNVKRHYGIRTERYKLLHFYNDIDEWELFDLYNDPDELNNLYGKEEYVLIANELKEQLEELQVHYQDTIQGNY
jgi:arylsulfatase A-like enzyme